ncbi:ABC transporter permease [Saccharothrix australiensis]|uniref:ABC-2 family transporter n=1 Tax=Saccharothrix australiensis TaxID=2072 RepID=A0A495W178_9PSEU|nr:ABC transporter permease [Saccharothrix australiensis]RKT55154.1 hypothetical protein C8E97_3812 [Saccharothrix australiensis]
MTRNPVGAAPGRWPTAAGFAILEHARNRLAIVLVIAFIPVWVKLIDWFIPGNPVEFRYRATDTMLTVDGQQVSFLSGALNAVTLIVGFVMFMTTRKSSEFDRRLVLAGYPRAHLVTAKLTALVVSSAVVSAYALAVLRVFWEPRQLWLIGAALFAATLAYGGIGIVLGVVLRGDLEGMFTIIMISMVDVLLQNPIGNPAANKDMVRYLPTYGPMQTGFAGGFTDEFPVRYLLIGPLWLVVCATIGLVAFRLRTRIHVAQTGSL